MCTREFKFQIYVRTIALTERSEGLKGLICLVKGPFVRPVTNVLHNFKPLHVILRYCVAHRMAVLKCGTGERGDCCIQRIIIVSLMMNHGSLYS